MWTRNKVGQSRANKAVSVPWPTWFITESKGARDEDLNYFALLLLLLLLLTEVANLTDVCLSHLVTMSADFLCRPGREKENR